jgi:hypothetical protein
MHFRMRELLGCIQCGAPCVRWAAPATDMWLPEAPHLCAVKIGTKTLT